MSAQELLNRLQALRPDEPVDWPKVRHEIHKEFKLTITSRERAMLLEMHKIANDSIERQIAPEKLENFRKLRTEDYNLLVVSECLIGENVSIELLYDVTQREVAAGRMSSDDELYALAQTGIEAPYLSKADLHAIKEQNESHPHPQPQPSLLAKALGWMRRSK